MRQNARSAAVTARASPAASFTPSSTKRTDATQKEARAYIQDHLGGDEDRYGVINSEQDGPAAQPGFAITPAMREKASAGMPLFDRSADATAARTPVVSAVERLVRAITANLQNAPEVVVAQDIQAARDCVICRSPRVFSRSMGHGALTLSWVSL